MGRAVLMPVRGAMSLIEVDVNDWRALAKAIGSEYIERVRIPVPDAAMIVDEEGLFTEKPTNWAAFGLYPGVIVGDVLIVGEVETPEGADFAGLSDESLSVLCSRMGIRPAALAGDHR